MGTGCRKSGSRYPPTGSLVSSQMWAGPSFGVRPKRSEL
jgi:hypothetical protein